MKKMIAMLLVLACTLSAGCAFAEEDEPRVIENAISFAPVSVDISDTERAVSVPAGWTARELTEVQIESGVCWLGINAEETVLLAIVYVYQEGETVDSTYQLMCQDESVANAERMTINGIPVVMGDYADETGRMYYAEILDNCFVGFMFYAESDDLDALGELPLEIVGSLAAAESEEIAS